MSSKTRIAYGATLMLALAGTSGAVVGANQADTHLKNVDLACDAKTTANSRPPSSGRFYFICRCHTKMWYNILRQETKAELPRRITCHHGL